MSDIVELIDEKARQKNKDRKKKMSGASYSESVRTKWFCCELDFVQLMCKASLTFESNLELVVSIILSESELYQSKHVVVEWRCLKIYD